jgi:hypothetical protein
MIPNHPDTNPDVLQEYECMYEYVSWIAYIEIDFDFEKILYVCNTS